MADGGISETAIAASVAAAAAEAEAAAATAAITAAATTAATAAEAGAAGAGLAGTAAAVAPEIVAAAPEAFTAAAAAAPEVTAAAAPAITEAPFLGATASEPALLGPSVAAPEVVAPTATTPSLLGAAPTTAPTATAPTTGLHSAAWEAGTGQFAPQTSAYSPGLLDQAGQWWQTASTGDKLAAGGKLLSGVGTAGSAASAAKGPPAKGPTRTIQPGAVGKPSGGEQQLAAIVDAMLKRRDAYQSGVGGGAPVAYRPRGLLG